MTLFGHQQVQGMCMLLVLYVYPFFVNVLIATKNHGNVGIRRLNFQTVTLIYKGCAANTFYQLSKSLGALPSSIKTV